MVDQAFLMWAGGFIISGLGVWLWNTYTSHTQLRADHETHKLLVAQDYVKRQELKDLFNDLKADNRQNFAELRAEIKELARSKLDRPN